MSDLFELAGLRETPSALTRCKLTREDVARLLTKCGVTRRAPLSENALKRIADAKKARGAQGGEL